MSDRDIDRQEAAGVWTAIVTGSAVVGVLAGWVHTVRYLN